MKIFYKCFLLFYFLISSCFAITVEEFESVTDSTFYSENFFHIYPTLTIQKLEAAIGQYHVCLDFFRPVEHIRRFPDPSYNPTLMCYFLGYSSLVDLKSYEVAAFDEHFFYYHYHTTLSGSFSLDKDCPAGTSLFPLTFQRPHESYVIMPTHSSCLADCLSGGWCSDEETSGCPNSFYYSIRIFYVCTCKIGECFSSQASQKTLIKTNDLISESNSKLGSVASSTATNTGLLSGILDASRSLLTKITGIFGTGDFVGNSQEDNSLIAFINRDSSLDVTQIQPLVSSEGACPSPISISFFGHSSQFSYQPTCDFAKRIRPIVVNAARVSAAWILIGAL